MPALTLLDLVENGTMNADIAATLATIATEKRSFMVVAVPREAGKSTVMSAMLDFVPGDIPIHNLGGSEKEMEELRTHPDGGYLVVAEFSRFRVTPAYIWGPAVRKVFQTLGAGFSLAVSLHASGLDEAFEEICQENGVTDLDASRINYMVFIQCLGHSWANIKRRIAAVYEISKVKSGKPFEARVLHRWLPEIDRFESVDEPLLLSAAKDTIDERARKIRNSARSDRTGAAGARKLKF